MQRIVQEKVGVDVKHPDPVAREHGECSSSGTQGGWQSAAPQEPREHSRVQEPREHGRVQVPQEGKKVAVFVSSDGCLNFMEGDNEVLVAGFGRNGHTRPRCYPWSLPEGC